MSDESNARNRHRIGGSRVLVTGGAGFIGSHVVDYLLAERARHVVVLDDLSSGDPDNLWAHRDERRLHLVTGDLRDIEAVIAATRGVDFVIHLAAPPFDRSTASPRECLEIMVDGTINVLEAAVDACVKKIVIGSCASVYGRASYLPLDEDHPLRSRSAYGAAKIAGEQIGRAYHELYGLDCIALRYFHVFGPRGGAPDQQPGGADLVHVEDASRAALLAIESDVRERVYNIASGTEGSAERARCELGWNPHPEATQELQGAAS